MTLPAGEWHLWTQGDWIASTVVRRAFACGEELVLAKPLGPLADLFW